MPVRRFVAGKSPALTWWTNANFTRPSTVSIGKGAVMSLSDFVTGMNRGRIDMATPYLREALRFIGVSEVRFALIGPTVGPADPARPRGRGPSIGGDGGKLLTEALSVRAVTIYVHGSEVVSVGFLLRRGHWPKQSSSAQVPALNVCICRKQQKRHQTEAAVVERRALPIISATRRTIAISTRPLVGFAGVSTKIIP